MITEFYYLGLFFVASVCVYAIIHSRTNRILTFLLIPAVLAISLWTWQAIYALQGTPRTVLPWDQKVEVLWTAQLKPWIYLLVVHKGDVQPTYYKIIWNDENQYKVNQIEKVIQSQGSAAGTFKQPQGQGTTDGSFFFTQMESFQELIRKGAPDRTEMNIPNGF